MTFVVFLHVATAVFVIGPLVAVTMATPRAIRAGEDGLPVLRWLHRATRVYLALSLVVFALGMAAVPLDHGKHAAKFGQFWLSSSMTLFVVALGLVVAVVYRDQRLAIRELQHGEPATVRSSRIGAVSGISALLWLAIVLLMVYRPGE